MLRSGLLVLRPVVADGSLTRPSWPARIVEFRREDAGWWTLLDQSSTTLHGCDCVRNAANDTAGVILVGPRAVIDLIAAQASQSWTLAQFIADAGAVATAIKGRFPCWRCDGTILGAPFSSQRVRFPDGTLPALPWVSGDLTVTARLAPAWDRTIAGYTDAEDTEQTS